MSQLKNSVKRSQQRVELSAWDNALAIAQQSFAELQAKADNLLSQKDNTITELTAQLEIASDPVAHRRQAVYQARQGDNPIPYDTLAAEWGVSPQTIKNDIKHYQNGK